jgi:hypothetical protein
MSLNQLITVQNAVLKGSDILHWYSPRQLCKSQLIRLKRNGINAICRKRDKAWFEIDFVKV